MVTLPEELLKSVFLQLRPTSKNYEDNKVKRNTLCCIARASKACHRVAIPEIYYSLDLSSLGVERLQPLLSVLLAKGAGLCSLVKEVHVPGWETRSSRDLHGKIREESSLQETLGISAALQGIDLSSPFLQQLQDGLSECLQDAWLAVLLLICPKLGKMHLRSPLGFHRTLVSSAISHSTGDADSSAGAVKPLQSVLEVEIEHGDTEGGTRIDELISILRLPSLVSLKGVGLGLASPSSANNAPASALKHVHLKDSLLDAAGTTWLFDLCPNLEKLHVHWGGSSVGRCKIEYDQISSVINSKGHHLHTLRLAPEDADPLNEDSLPISSLQKATSLRVLTLPSNALFMDPSQADDEHQIPLIDILPTSLQILRITQADDDDAEFHDNLLLSLMNNDRFWSLTTIRVNRREKFTGDLSGSMWDDSESNKFWVVLSRK